MNRLITLFLISCPAFMFAQTNNGNPSTARDTRIADASQPVYVIDSIPYAVNKTYLDANNIQNIQVLKGVGSSIWSGRSDTYLITRKDKNRAWVTLAEINRQVGLAEDSLPISYVVDGVVLEDTSNVLFESAVIQKLDVTKGLIIVKGHSSPKNVVLIETKKNKKGKKSAANQLPNQSPER